VGNQAGGSAIIAVKLASATGLAVNRRPAGELGHGGPLLDELDIELQQAARLDRIAELGTLDRHEVDQLAAAARSKLSTASTPAACASASTISTPGMIGRPGK
jgi:hypothetical protein